MACDPSTLIASGKAFQALSEQQQWICIAQLLCDISASGGGGGSGSVLAGDYGGVAPVAIPTGPAIAKDTITGRIWYYDGVSWA